MNEYTAVTYPSQNLSFLATPLFRNILLQKSVASDMNTTEATTFEIQNGTLIVREATKRL